MIRKYIELLPFVHHQPPISIPLRKAIVMSLQRPVKINSIEAYLSQKYSKNPTETTDNLEKAIDYLRRERLLKKDCNNLFVAGLRAICAKNPEKGVSFGLRHINKMPDSRAIRTLITYLSRLNRYTEALELLNLSKNKIYNISTKQKILSQTI